MDTEQIAAEIFHHGMAVWRGEIKFYEQLALDARSILEVALHYLFWYELELS